MDAAMEATAEFKNLVATHQRLTQKYGDRRGWTQSTEGMTFDDFSTRQNYVPPWTEQMYGQNFSYPTQEAGHYWSRSLDDYDLASGDTMRDKALYASPSRDAANVNHMISLQLASMEYARLLMRLNATHPLTPPYHKAQLQTDAFPVGLQSDDYSAVQGNNKRRSDEKDDVQKTIPVKRARLVWTKDLHQKFVEAVDKIGIDKAVPKAILEAMGIEGLTRENVASHLQKYRLQKGYRSTSKKLNGSGTRKIETSSARCSNDGESDSTASIADNMSHSFVTAKRSDRF